MIAMGTPRFSILIPVYNREVFVKECIDSILSQSFSEFEIIAIDDGSSDHSFETLQTYGNRIIALQQKNQGPEFARDFGASLAQGEYLVFLDSDDILLPGALETYNSVIESSGAPAMLIGRLHYYPEGQLDIGKINPHSDVEVLKFRDYFSKDISVGLSCSNIIIKRSVFKQAGGNRHSWPPAFPADEHDTVLRFGAYGPCIFFLNPKTIAYRMHNGNVINDVDRMIEIGIRTLIRSELAGLYPGGKRRILERYNIIGGMAICWIKKAFKSRRFFLGLKLLLIAGPMIAGGTCNKIFKLLRPRTRPFILTKEPFRP
jgi:glycosyltransferase involved in cell wall biosynthesis